jgi:hypothetical protein
MNLVYDHYTASANEDDFITLDLAELEEGYMVVVGTQLQENRYYRLRPNDFPPFDSLLLLKHRDQETLIVLLKIGCNGSDNDQIANGLRKMDDLELTSNASRCCVVAAPEGIEPTVTVSTEYLEGKGLVNQLVDQGFGVFYQPANMTTLFVD